MIYSARIHISIFMDEFCCMGFFSAFGQHKIPLLIYIHIFPSREIHRPLSLSHLYICKLSFDMPASQVQENDDQKGNKKSPSSSSYNTKRYEFIYWMDGIKLFSLLALRHALPVVVMDNFLFKTRENLSPFQNIHIYRPFAYMYEYVCYDFVSGLLRFDTDQSVQCYV